MDEQDTEQQETPAQEIDSYFGDGSAAMIERLVDQRDAERQKKQQSTEAQGEKGKPLTPELCDLMDTEVLNSLQDGDKNRAEMISGLAKKSRAASSLRALQGRGSVK